MLGTVETLSGEARRTTPVREADPLPMADATFASVFRPDIAKPLATGMTVPFPSTSTYPVDVEGNGTGTPWLDDVDSRNGIRVRVLVTITWPGAGGVVPNCKSTDAVVTEAAGR
ncbi:MAG: hypothetical protein WBQ14_00960 [Gaiellaceae bacterium]